MKSLMFVLCIIQAVIVGTVTYCYILEPTAFIAGCLGFCFLMAIVTISLTVNTR